MVLRSSYIEPVFGHRPGYQRVCVSTDEADWPKEGVETRRFFLVVLEGHNTSELVVSDRKTQHRALFSHLMTSLSKTRWIPFYAKSQFLRAGSLPSDTMLSTCNLLSSLTMTAVFRASCTPCRWYVRPGIIALPFQVFSRRPVCFTFLSIPFVQTYRSGLHPKPHAPMQWS